MSESVELFRPFTGLFVASKTEMPYQIGRGGEKITFFNPENNQVVKVSYYMLSSREFNSGVLSGPQDQSDTDFEDIEGLAINLTLRSLVLTEVFGSDRVVPSEIQAKKFPLDGLTCSKLWGSSPIKDNEVRLFNTIITKEPYLPMFSEPEKYDLLGLNVGYAEKADYLATPEGIRDYISSCRRFIELDNSLDSQSAETDEAIFDRIQGGENHQKLVRLIESNDVFAKLFVDIILKAREYSILTDEALDFGDTNLLFFRNSRYENDQWIYSPGEDWQYLLDDCLKPPGGEFFMSDSKRILNRFLGGTKLSRGEKGPLLNTLTYVKFLNYWIDRLEIPIEKIDLLGGRKLSDAMWESLLYQLRQTDSLVKSFPTQFYNEEEAF